MNHASGKETQAFGPILSELAFRNAEEQDWEGGIEGVMPDWAHGSLYLNGPGAYSRNGHDRGHWIDGDGLVRRLGFGGKSARFQSRYVRTQRFVEEQSTQTAPCRSFGTAFPGDRLRRGLALFTPANVSVHPIGGRLLAFGEQSLPWRLDRETLETLDECDFAGSFTGITPLSAHPKMDVQGGRMCNFGALYLGARTRFLYQEWDSGLNPMVSGHTELESSHLVHDCLISEHYACFHLSPYYLDILSFVRNGLPLLDAMHWEPDLPGQWLIFSRATGEALAQVQTGVAGFCLHTLNAREQDGLLILDTLETHTPYYGQYFADPGLFSSIGTTQLRRTLLRCEDWSLAETSELQAGMHLDFPCIGPGRIGRDYRHAWMLAMPTAPHGSAKFYDRLVRFDWSERQIVDSYLSPPGSFLGAEPQLVPGPGRGDSGILVCQEIDVRSERSAYLFFNAFDLSRGPTARAQLPFFDPPAFHTSLLSEADSAGNT